MTNKQDLDAAARFFKFADHDDAHYWAHGSKLKEINELAQFMSAQRQIASNPTSHLQQSLRAWSPLIASGYDVPAASQIMLEAANYIDQLEQRIKELTDEA